MEYQQKKINSKSSSFQRQNTSSFLDASSAGMVLQAQNDLVKNVEDSAKHHFPYPDGDGFGWRYGIETETALENKVAVDGNETLGRQEIDLGSYTVGRRNRRRQIRCNIDYRNYRNNTRIRHCGPTAR